MLLSAITFYFYILDAAFVDSIFDLCNLMPPTNRLYGSELKPCPQMDKGAHFRMFHACCNASATVIIMAE
jgi:hypothetical protein